MHLFAGLKRWAVLVVILGLGTFIAAPEAAAQSSEAIEKQIEELRDQLRAVEAARSILTDQTINQNRHRDALQRDIDTIENFKRLPDEAIKTANLLIRRSERLIAKALSPIEKFKAFEKYEASQKTVEDFKTLFKTFRGQEPDRTTVQQRGIFERILDLERRKLLVSDVAGPLALAGKGITEVGFFFAKSSAFADFARRSVGNKIKVQVYKTSVKLEGAGRASLSLAETMEQSANRVREAKRNFGVESANVSDLLKKVNAVSAEKLQSQLSDAVNVLDEETTDEELLLVMDLADGNPQFDASVKQLQQAQQDFAALANTLASKVRVGRQGFVENVGQSVLVRRATEPVMEAANRILAAMGKLRSRVAEQSDKFLAKLKPIQESLDRNEAAIAQLVKEANDLDQQIFELSQKRFAARLKEQKIDQVSNPVITSLNVGVNRNVRISTNRFGELIGLKNNTPLSVRVGIGTLETQQCRHSCRRNETTGRQTCQQATRKVFVRRGSMQLDASGLSRFGITVKPTGVLRVSNERGLALLRAPGPGRGTVEASAAVLKEIQQRNHVCGTEDVVVKQNVTRATRSVQVLHVDHEEFEVEGLTAQADGALGRIDFFARNTQPVSIRVMVENADGERKSQTINGGFEVDVSGDKEIVDVRKAARGVEITPKGVPGLARLELMTAIKPGGQELRVGRILASFTKFSDEVEFPAGPWTLDGDNFIPPGKNVEFSAFFEGGVNPDDLSINWQVDGTRKDQLQTSGGARFGNGGKATLRAAFDRKKVFRDGDNFEGTFNNRAINVFGTVNYAGRAVFNTRRTTFFIGQPILKSAQIGLRGEGSSFVPVKRRDFITPTVQGEARLGQIAIRGTFDGGVRKFLNPSRFEQIISGAEGLINERGEINLNALGSLNGEVSKASTVFVSATYEASVGPARGRGYYVIDGDVDDQFGLSINKLLLEKEEEFTSRLVRARVVGPAKFTGLNAVFETEDDSLTVPMEGDGDDLIAEVEADPFSIKSVTILNAGGIAVARLIPEIHGQPLGKLKIALDHPPTAKPGQVVVVSAQILNIESKGIESNGIRCQWNTDPGVGTFDQAVTDLEPMTITTGFCVNVLRVSEDLPGGRDVDLPIGLALVLEGQ